jgi:hypothetical protein
MEWVTSKQLMVALGATEPDPNWKSPNADAVCRRACDGVMHARTTAFFKNEEPLGECDLPKEFWWAGADSYHLKRNWVTGDFLTNDPHAGDEWRPWKAYGVQWCKEDAEAMGADFSASAVEPVLVQVSKGGRKRLTGWVEFVAELCYFVHNDGLPSGSGTEGTDAVIRTVLDRLEERGVRDAPERSTVQPSVNAMLEKIRAGN